MTGVLDTKPYTDERNRAWMFRTCGYGHGEQWWRSFVSTLRMFGYDYVLSIEHEDSLLSAEEGLTRAARFLSGIVPRRETRSRVVGLIKSAIIGTGFMGRVHFEAARRLGTVEPVLLSHSQFERALKDPEIRAVHICTPNAAHTPMAKAALRAGKHVLCEKPLATSSADAARLVALAAERGLRNCTCHNLRYYPQVQQMRAMREAGELGEILVVQGTYSQDWLLYETDWNWRIDPAASRALARAGRYRFALVRHGGARDRLADHESLRGSADLPQDSQAPQAGRRDVSPVRR